MNVINPMTGELLIEKKQVLIFGFSKEVQNKILKELPAEMSLRICCSINELMVEKNIYSFIDPNDLTGEEIRNILEFHDDYF